jgi:3-hydroxyacyl-CoA dehydrogenase
LTTGWPRFAACDWVIEAVTENLEIKRALWRRAAASARRHAILSTNTSGIPLSAIAAGLNDACQPRFLGTHFFNPPRYLHLLELDSRSRHRRRPARGHRLFRRSPPRQGCGALQGHPELHREPDRELFRGDRREVDGRAGLAVEEVDLLTGPLIGLPKSASLRLLDVVGRRCLGFRFKQSV